MVPPVGGREIFSRPSAWNDQGTGLHGVLEATRIAGRETADGKPAYCLEFRIEPSRNLKRDGQELIFLLP
jgi:hypothetical protein